MTLFERHCEEYLDNFEITRKPLNNVAPRNDELVNYETV